MRYGSTPVLTLTSGSPSLQRKWQRLDGTLSLMPPAERADRTPATHTDSSKQLRQWDLQVRSLSSSRLRCSPTFSLCKQPQALVPDPRRHTRHGRCRGRRARDASVISLTRSSESPPRKGIVCSGPLSASTLYLRLSSQAQRRPSSARRTRRNIGNKVRTAGQLVGHVIRGRATRPGGENLVAVRL